MKNPWLEIPLSDYENHMLEVGQAQALNKIIKQSLERYLPENFALLGCSTGNGLEHIKSEITKKVFAIDINSDYLKKTKENFKNRINRLEIINADIQNDEVPIKNVDLFFVGLVLEYVDPETVLEKIINLLSKNGILLIVIQKSTNTTFVSKTKYKSLEKLADISNEVNEKEINSLIQSQNMKLINRDEIELTNNKSFIRLDYRMNEK